MLLARVVDGDTASFGELYRRHVHHALVCARKLCISDELAEEVVQESFISLWLGARRYCPERGSVRAWLASIVRNQAIDRWRRAASRPVETPFCDELRGGLPAARGIETPLLQRAIVRSLLAELPAPQKEAVFLAYFADLTHEEIAVRSGAPVGTVKGRIRLGMQKIGVGLERPLRGHEPVAAAPPTIRGARRRAA